ncbi:MAG: serine/threonine-protein kinase [Acidobacteriota bacterium]|nr:serine/threonine-protein kinase [Acidobacteriota bacterium]
MESGAKLGRYEIRRKIGAGGMGEVFLAQDLELDRPVALKVLPAEFCCNLERVQRFKLEARAASALNHPNIITIYEIAEADERLFIATEFIDGETLRQKIEKSELTVFDAVTIAEQVASALSVAHEAHIKHRDIKPENIMISRDGYVKILDFGLAKLSVNPPTGAEDKTLQMVTTQAGMVMGSVSYMSPEQARGKEVDERTDIWSLGVVLYEMVTGRNPFAGETVSDSLAALIHVEPEPLDAYVEDVPEELQWIVRKTLRKKPDERYQSIKDLALDLKDLRYKFEHVDADNRTRKFNAYNVKTAAHGRISTGENKTLIHDTTSAEDLASRKKTRADNRTELYSASESAATSERRSRSRSRGVGWRFLPLLILGLAAALAFGAWYYQPFSQKETAVGFDNVQISRLTESGKSSAPAISPDGKYVVYVNNENGMRSLVVRQIATGSNVQIVPPSNLVFYQPTFSPDGDYIYYIHADKGVGTLYQIPTLGGTAKKIIVDVDSKVSFSPDGKRLAFVRHDVETGSSAVYLINADGSNPEVLIDTGKSGETRFSEVAWSPSGDEVLVGAIMKVFGDDSHEGKILLVSLKDKSFRQFGERTWMNLSSFAWLKDKSGFYFLAKASLQDQKQIWFFSYPAAEARQITSDSSGYSTMSLSADGATIAASKVDIISSLWAFNPQNKEMTQVSAENKMMQGVGGLTHLPDGRILFARTEGTRTNLWTMDEDGRSEKALLQQQESGDNIHPAVSPDGKFIVFSSNSRDGWRIWKADIDGKNAVQLTRQASSGDFRPQVLPDNKTIVFERRLDNIMKARLMKIPLEGGGEEQPLFPESQASDAFPNLSDDGRRLAFTTQIFDSKNLTFQNILKIAEIKEADVLPPKETKIDNISWNYRWTKDGKNLTYMSVQGVPNIFDFAVDGGASGKPRQLTNFNSGIILNFDWANDGKRLFIVRGVINSDLILIKDVTKST